jgi:hypothetical protein
MHLNIGIERGCIIDLWMKGSRDEKDARGPQRWRCALNRGGSCDPKRQIYPYRVVSDRLSPDRLNQLAPF